MTNSMIFSDPDKISIDFRCLRAQQPIGDLFIAVIDHKTLQRISFFDVRRRLQEQRDIEKYLGIQRPLDDRRVREIRGYVNFADATFPTSIILAIDEKYASFDEISSKMTIRNFSEDELSPSIMLSNIARVIDGQHRIAGLDGFSSNDGNFDCPVTIFIGADISDQAHIFATVNLEQTKVNKSLAYDLYSLSKSRSPQKTCHNIAVALDVTESSALFQRIKRLGFATDGRLGETLTQATVVEGLLSFISIDPKSDRDTLLRGHRLLVPSAAEHARAPFRVFFAAEQDLDIAEIFFNFFNAVQERWPVAWRRTSRGSVLSKTNGYRALLRFLKSLYLDKFEPRYIPKANEFGEFLSRIHVDDSQFDVDVFPPGTGGEAKLLRVLMQEERLTPLPRS